MDNKENNTENIIDFTETKENKEKEKKIEEIKEKLTSIGKTAYIKGYNDGYQDGILQGAKRCARDVRMSMEKIEQNMSDQIAKTSRTKRKSRDE